MAFVENNVEKTEDDNLNVDNVLKLSSIVPDMPPSAIITATTVVEEFKSTSEGEPRSDDERINLNLHPDRPEEISDTNQPKKGTFFHSFLYL